MKFIDIANIDIRSGAGGAGHISFRREKYVPKGGPDGGNGGKGGDVIFIADPHLSTLLDFKYQRHFYAKNGSPGGKSNKTGKNGANCIIKVPCGTVIKNTETNDIIADLTEHYETYTVADGGKGGRGNWEFRTPTQQTPRFAEPGMPGIELSLTLELKIIADVGIVGFPNVGKSTLISTLSAAKPKIADYPFTTLVPNLGIVKIDFAKNYTMADIPGLIEGAAEGRGLGIQFLRHIERTKILLFMLDALSDDVRKDFDTLMDELKKYNPNLIFKKRVICISRIDAVSDERKAELIKMKFKSEKSKQILISSVTHQNIEKIKFLLWDMINQFNSEDN